MPKKKEKKLKNKKMALKLAVHKVQKSISKTSNEELEMQYQFFTEIVKILEEERGKRNA